MSLFSIFRTQNQVSGLMAVGELISHLQQEREGLIFRMISNGTMEYGYYIRTYYINAFRHKFWGYLNYMSFSSFDALLKLFRLTDTTIQNMEWKLLSTSGFPVFDKKLRFQVCFFGALSFWIRVWKHYMAIYRCIIKLRLS